MRLMQFHLEALEAVILILQLSKNIYRCIL